MWGLNLIAAVFTMLAFAMLLPKANQKELRQRNFRILSGFETLKSSGNKLGIKITLWHYGIMVLVGGLIGLGLGMLTHNIFLVIVGVVAGYIFPNVILDNLIYTRRRNIIINLVPNLKLFTSKLLEGKSIERALDLSLSSMNGITLPIFKNLYERLRLGTNVEVALVPFRQELRLDRVEDLCEKLLSGSVDGFHSKAIASIQKTIKNISEDIVDIQTLEIENKKKKVMTVTFMFIVWAFPILFAYIEQQLIEQGGGVLTVTTVPGKLMLMMMAINMLLCFKYLNPLTRFDFK